MAMTKQRLGKRVHDVVNRMRQGEVLCSQFSQADGLSFWLEPSGRSVGPQTARKVVNLPSVEGARDCLLGNSQTYRYRSIA